MSVAVLGGITTDLNEVNLATASAMPTWTPRGGKMGINHTWVVRGITRASSQSALTTKLAARDAEWVDGGVLDEMVLYLGPGTTNATVHSVDDDDTLNGIQVRKFEYTSPGPWFSQTEYVWKRSWQLVLTAEKITGTNEIYQFSETFEQIGTGGADSVIQEALTGNPQLQVTKAVTKFMYRQYGIAVKVGSYYAFPNAAYPSNVLPKQTRYWQKSPQRKGTLQSILFPSGWHYLMHAPTNLGFVSPDDP
jgi:hypothetical protein